MQELQQALQEMDREKNNAVGSSAVNGNRPQLAEDADHEMPPDDFGESAGD